ncbi:MAG: DUF2283 domain-containing protein [Chloroflexota bacterium]
MKITYDAQVDVLRILLSDVPVDESDEDRAGVIVDYDDTGNIVGIEILDAAKRGLSPHNVEYAITGLHDMS